MTVEDTQDFAKHLAALAETFGEPLSSARIRGYFTALEDLPMEAACGAIREALRCCKFFPKPSELRALAGEVEPDCGVVESLIMGRLYGRAISHGDFVDLAIERLGGRRACEDMPPAVRLGHLHRMLPALLAAGRARGWSMPTAATDAPMIRRTPEHALPDYANDALPPLGSPMRGILTGLVKDIA